MVHHYYTVYCMGCVVLCVVLCYVVLCCVTLCCVVGHCGAESPADQSHVQDLMSLVVLSANSCCNSVV